MRAWRKPAACRTTPFCWNWIFTTSNRKVLRLIWISCFACCSGQLRLNGRQRWFRNSETLMLAAILLAFASVVVFYLLIGYPILLANSRRFAPPIGKNMAFRPTVSILIAVYNGGEFIAGKLES